MSQRPVHFGWQDFVVLVAFECVAVPICIASGEAFVSGHYDRAVFGWTIGIPLAVAGFTARWWKGWLSEEVRQTIFARSERWWPVAVFLAFVYVAGPEIYHRIVGPAGPISSLGISAPAAHRPSSPEVSTPLAPGPSSPGVSAPSIVQPILDVDISGDIKLLRNEQLRTAAFTIATRIDDYADECTKKLYGIASSGSLESQRAILQIQSEQECDRQYREKFAATLARLHAELRRRLSMPAGDSRVSDAVLTIGRMRVAAEELRQDARRLP